MTNLLPWTSIVVVLATCCAQPTQAFAAKPNLVILFTDDMGYSDLGCYGGQDIPTPNLDRLAREGTKFTSAYTVAPICVPSRMGLMSGKFPARFGVFNNVYSLEQNRIWIEEKTLADYLKGQGYRTANIGKWHLSGNSSLDSGDHLGGFQFKPPHQRGFDEFVGLTGGMHQFWKGTELARWQGEKYERFAAPDYLTDFFGSEAVRFIERNPSQPFFLYLAFNAPHAPLHGLDEDQQAIGATDISPDRRIYAAMVRAVDRNVGRVMDKLRQLGLHDQTMTVFLNDNGGGGNNALAHTRNTARNIPYRGHKFDVWEGGIRIPFILHWPGHVPEGKAFDGMVSSTDVVPTFLKAASGEIPTGLDGVDLMPFVLNNRSQPESPSLANQAAVAGDNHVLPTVHPHATLCWQQQVWSRPNERKMEPGAPNPSYNFAIRQGSWKAVKQDQPFDGSNDARGWELYDLSRDPAELNDLASEFPERVQALSAAFFAWQNEMPKPIPVTSPSQPSRPLKAK